MIKSITLIICLLSIFGRSNAFFGEPTELDLYKNIDSGIDMLEEKMIGFELNGSIKETGITIEINNIAISNGDKECLDESVEIDQPTFQKIIDENDVSKISSFFLESCLKEIGGVKKYSDELLLNYLTYFKEHYHNSKNIAEKKTKQIHTMSSIGLYSDGILENSGFDLIVDIEEIDKIIFSTKTDYEGEDDVDIEAVVEEAAEAAIDAIEDKLIELGNNILSPNEEDDEIITRYKPNNNFIPNQNELGSNNYVCSEAINNTGLDNDELSFILNTLDNDEDINKKDKSNHKRGISGGNGDKGRGASGGTEAGGAGFGGYEKVRDNTQWPCEDFFCINIDFVIYEHLLLMGDTGMTIEYLLNRSNEHLSKFAASYLGPAKMATNLFELGLKDLNLPDIFHMAIMVTTKPIPILNIEDEDKQDETEFASKNLIHKYYQANGLDYNRRNDLVLLRRKEQEKQVLINSEKIHIKDAIIKHDEYFNDYLENKKKTVELINKSVEKKVSYGVLENFEAQYIELDKFTFAIYDYIENLHTIIKKMREIPIDKG